MIDEGVIKFELTREHGPPPDAGLVAELERWRALLFEARLIGHDEVADVGYGNLSIRSRGAGYFVISGTQTGHLAVLGPQHYALVTDYDIAANRLSCRGPVRASSESLTHAALYELSRDIAAVVHVHSDALWQRHIDRLPTTRRTVAYGTPQMADEFGRLYRDTDFPKSGLAVMGGHDGGLVATGRSVAEAAQRILDLDGHAQRARAGWSTC